MTERGRLPGSLFYSFPATRYAFDRRRIIHDRLESARCTRRSRASSRVPVPGSAARAVCLASSRAPRRRRRAALREAAAAEAAAARASCPARLRPSASRPEHRRRLPRAERHLSGRPRAPRRRFVRSRTTRRFALNRKPFLRPRGRGPRRRDFSETFPKNAPRAPRVARARLANPPARPFSPRRRAWRRHDATRASRTPIRTRLAPDAPSSPSAGGSSPASLAATPSTTPTSRRRRLRSPPRVAGARRCSRASRASLKRRAPATRQRARRPPRETSPSRAPRTTSFGLRRKVRSVSRARDAPRSRPCGAEGCSRRPRAGASRARRRAHRRSTRSLRGNRARRLSRTKRGSRGSRGSPTRRAARDLPRGGTRGPPRVGSSGPSEASRAESRASRESRERCHATSSVAGQGRGGHRGEPRRATATATGAGLPLRHRPGVVPAGSGSDCGSSSCRGAAHGAGTRGRARRPTSTARRRTTRRRARVSKCRRARRRWDDSDGRATGRVRLFRASARDRDGARAFRGGTGYRGFLVVTSRLSRDEYRHATRGAFTILSSPLSSMRSSPSPPRRACSP